MSDHDHDIEYARKHHLHYDLAGDAERAHSRITRLQEELDGLRAELAGALGRIRQLEEQTPEARQAEYEADVAMADSEPWRDPDADCGCGLGAARCRALEDGEVPE